MIVVIDMVLEAAGCIVRYLVGVALVRGCNLEDGLLGVLTLVKVVEVVQDPRPSHTGYFLQASLTHLSLLNQAQSTWHQIAVT